ncbi:MAG TPA: hypothetical protein PJ990_15895 [Saprospiraceae bacterium]|nr:hypothetical protein [Saprospiraceae bacterium]
MSLITRQDAVKNEVFASFIASWQKRFDPREDPYITTPGNYFDSELGIHRYFYQMEIDKINDLELAEFLSLKDEIEVKNFEYYGELIFKLDFSDIFVYAIELGNVMQKFSSSLGADLIFILDHGVPWMSQKNDYEPVTKALNYLTKIGTTETFNGAYKLSGDDLAEFVGNLFWIIRCNASLPYCWFSTENHAFVGEICKHGNIHFHTYSQMIKDKIEVFAQKETLVVIDDCVEAFSDDGGISGRQIII